MHSIMDGIAVAAEYFVGLFYEGGNYFVLLFVDIVPMMMVLLTFMNALIKGLGEEKINNFCIKFSGNFFFRSLLLPLFTTVLMTTTIAMTFGRFLPDKYKASYFDCLMALCHPILGLFPHANAAEYFVYSGIAAGIIALELNLSSFAIWYLIAGLLNNIVRTFVTDKMYAVVWKAQHKNGSEEVTFGV
jgi:PTS system glucitol/sorbitol-specific IIC component